MKRWNVIMWLILALTVMEGAWAGDLEWSGVYRIEGLTLENPLLKSGEKKSKDYGVHQLILRPKIVAGDGLYISAQLNVFNSHADNHGTWGNQLGAIFGNGLGDGGGVAAHSGNPNTLSEHQDEELITLSQFYLTHVQQYGSLLVGRAPVHFGLGMVHNAGRGLFDHYADTRDLVGYKVVAGNFYIFPMYGKVSEGGLSGYDDVKEWLVQLLYDNPESATKMGLMYMDRSAHLAGNDSTNPDGGPFGMGNPVGDFKYKVFNIFFERDFDEFSVGFEVANQTGKTGAVDANAVPIDISGMGAALEMEYKPKDKKWRAGLKAGWATGDDPTTAEYEGFVFDRNYDVAMMMFNHALGQANFLHTQINGTSFPADGGSAPFDTPDVEAISNVMYVSPYFHYQWKDQWSFGLSVTTGWLDRTQLTNPNVDGDNGLGYEVDLSLNYSPNERVVWQNTFGWLTPGAAFEANNSFTTSAAYGFLSRAAISF